MPTKQEPADIEHKQLAKFMRWIEMQRASRVAACVRELRSTVPTRTTSGEVTIASPTASEVPSETLSATRDEHARSGTIGEAHDEVRELTFAESRAAHAKTYLTAVLTVTGGERTRAAEIAGLKRAHMHALIRKHGIQILFDPKARGRRRRAAR